MAVSPNWKCKNKGGVYTGQREKETCIANVVMGHPGIGLIWDHKDGNDHNNLESNLRKATQQQNCFNRRPRKDSESGLKGIHFRKDNGMWSVSLMVNGKYLYLGQYATWQEAAKVWNEAARRHHGEFAYQNPTE